MKFSSKSVLLPLLALSTCAFAQPNDQFLFSADAGIAQVDFANQYRDMTDLIVQNIAQSSQQYGYTGGLALAYSYVINSTYMLGLGLSANLNTGSANYQSGAATAAFSDNTFLRYHIDLIINPGVLLTDNLYAYLKLGVSLARIKDSLSSPAGYSPVTVITSAQQTSLGFASGVGIAKVISNHLRIFSEFNYQDYGSVNFPSFTNFTATYSHSTHVYAYALIVGASYAF